MTEESDDEFWKEDEIQEQRKKHERQAGERLPAAATGPEPPKPVRWAALNEDLHTEVKATFSLAMIPSTANTLAFISLVGFAYMGLIATGVAVAIQFALMAQLFGALVRIQNTLADVTVRLDNVQRNQKIAAERK